MAAPRILASGAFRTHFLLANDIVGAVTHANLSGGVEVEHSPPFDIFKRHGRPFMRVAYRTVENKLYVTVTAMTDLWLQEPGLSVVVAGKGNWRGFGPRGWTSEWYDLSGTPDAHRATVHFSRVKTNPDYTTGVEYRPDTKTQSSCRWRSDGGFTELLDTTRFDVPWQGADIFGTGRKLVGVYANRSKKALKRWELAAWSPPRVPSFQALMHFLGWVGGPGAVVASDGRERGSPANAYLWDPASWRLLRNGAAIRQTLTTVKKA